MKAIIMAGGEGSRLRPLTCDRPKPMVPVANQPIMAYAIELLKKYGIIDIGVTLQYLPQAIQDYFGDGDNYGVNLSYYIEETPLGTAGSVKNAEPFLDDTFIVVSGDALTDFDLSQAIAFHKEQGSIATLVLTTVENPLEYGVVITDKEGRIRRFLEKPSWGEVFSDRVNTGIYILEPEVLSWIPPGRMFDFSKDLFPALLAKGMPMFGCVLDGYWCDIGNLQQYRQSHYDLLEGKVKASLPDMDAQGIRWGQGVEVHPSATLEGPLLLGDYCVIGPNAVVSPYSVIGDRTVVEEGASIKRAILWENVAVGRHAALRGSVVGRQVRIGVKAAIYEGAVIGDETRVGDRAVVKPDVKVWPYKIIESGTTLTTSLVWGGRTAKSLFGKWGVPGIANMDISPEFAVRLGSAYGSSLPKDSMVAVSCDGSTITGMLKQAFATGIRSTGVSTVDLGDLATPMHRFALSAIKVKGGVHVKRDARDHEKIWLHFMDDKGIDITPNTARKVENMFWREDFRRVKGSEVGKEQVFPHISDSYIRWLINEVDLEAIKKKHFRVVVDCHAAHVADLLDPLWEVLGCEIEPFFVPITNQEQDFQELPKMLPHLAREVLQHGADLGVMMDSNAENLVLVDDKGQVIQDPHLTILMSLIVFHSKPGSVVVVPVTASKAVEQLAERYNGQVIRTKTAPYALMEAVMREEIKEKQGKYCQMGLQFDAVQGMVKLMDYLALNKVSLSELVASLPESYVHSQATDCPWEAKGKVMRTLIEEETGSGVELLDGIKINHEQGWALVLPHTDEPSYQVFSEGFNQEYAEELTNLYINKIRAILTKDRQN
ncbi:MAG: sugar phosphate nucleotidyltransferase [Bacillota bacterium]